MSGPRQYTGFQLETLADVEVIFRNFHAWAVELLVASAERMHDEKAVVAQAELPEKVILRSLTEVFDLCEDGAERTRVEFPEGFAVAAEPTCVEFPEEFAVAVEPTHVTGSHESSVGLLRSHARAMCTWGALARKIVSVCTAVPYSTSASRRAAVIHPPPLLRQVRQDRLALDRGSLALRANRRLEQALVRQFETRRFRVGGGLRQRRFQEGWRSISALTFSEEVGPTVNRDEWRRGLQEHWKARFADPMDDAAAQETFRRSCTRMLSSRGVRPLQVTLGEVVSGLGGAKCGSGAGSDGVVAEMLQLLPFSAVCVVQSMLNARFCSVGGAHVDDPLRVFLTTWIRKDTESDTLASHRPIMSSSSLLK